MPDETLEVLLQGLCPPKAWLQAETTEGTCRFFSCSPSVLPYTTLLLRSGQRCKPELIHAKKKNIRDYLVHSIALPTAPSAAAVQQRPEQGGAGAQRHYCCHQIQFVKPQPLESPALPLAGQVHTSVRNPSKLKDSIFAGTFFFHLK